MPALQKVGQIAIRVLPKVLLKLAAIALCVTAYAANAAEWKFNNGLPEGRNESKQLDQFAADVAELSGGSLSVKVFHGGSLNLKNNDVARWLPQGAVEMGLVWANYLGRDAPALNAVLIQKGVTRHSRYLYRRTGRMGHCADWVHGFAVVKSIDILSRRTRTLSGRLKNTKAQSLE